MNIFQLSLLLAILLKCVTASESGVAQDVIKAVEEDGFGRIRDDWYKWQHRNDLFDHVVMKSVEFIVGFINQVENARKLTLAALFIKRSDKVDQVLENVKYDDIDLRELTSCRPELAESHECFFKAIDKIKDPRNQEEAIVGGVHNLLKAKQHGSVIPLINALEKRQFNGIRLKNVAIQRAFYSGAWRGIKYIVEEFHEHPAITPKWYGYGLITSWENDKSKMVFPFLLAQADQGDLEEVKKFHKYKNDPEFSKGIDDAFPRAEPAGSRHARPAERERAKVAMKTFSEIPGIEPLGKEEALGGIISGYLA